MDMYIFLKINTEFFCESVTVNKDIVIREYINIFQIKSINYF